MDGKERRERIIGELGRADKPLSGSALAKQMGVSRQVIERSEEAFHKLGKQFFG